MPEGCEECYAFYRRFIAEPAGGMQKKLNRLSEDWTAELLQQYADFFAEHNEIIAELLERISSPPSIR